MMMRSVFLGAYGKINSSMQLFQKRICQAQGELCKVSWNEGGCGV